MFRYHCLFCDGSEDRDSASAGVLAIGDIAKMPPALHLSRMAKRLAISILLDNRVMHVVTSRKRVFSNTTYLFIMWTVGSSIRLITPLISLAWPLPQARFFLTACEKIPPRIMVRKSSSVTTKTLKLCWPFRKTRCVD